MRTFARQWTRRLVYVGAVAVLSSLAACGSDKSTNTSKPGEGGSTVSATKSQKAIDLLPQSVKSSGKLTVVMDGTQGKPFTYYANDNKTLVGLTSDLEKAIGQALGLTVNTQNSSFDNLIPGLQANHYALSIAPMLMTPKRLETVDMIGWLHGGSAFLIASGKGKENLTLDQTCGMTVGATTGSVEADSLAGQSAKCASAGKKGVDVKLYPHTSDGIVALAAGRIQAFDTAAAQSAYAAKLNPQLKQSGQAYSTGTSAMALPKNSPSGKAITAAFQHLIDTGVYKQILDSYGLQSLAVPSASLNTPV